MGSKPDCLAEAQQRLQGEVSLQNWLPGRLFWQSKPRLPSRAPAKSCRECSPHRIFCWAGSLGQSNLNRAAEQSPNQACEENSPCRISSWVGSVGQSDLNSPCGLSWGSAGLPSTAQLIPPSSQSCGESSPWRLSLASAGQPVFACSFEIHLGFYLFIYLFS